RGHAAGQARRSPLPDRAATAPLHVAARAAARARPAPGHGRLVTDGGLVPRGNPDRPEQRPAAKVRLHPLPDADAPPATAYEVSHPGYDNTYVAQDPHRLVPVDDARELEREGRIGRLHDHFLTTTGVGTPLETSRRLGREMAEHLQEAGVDAVILTST